MPNCISVLNASLEVIHCIAINSILSVFSPVLRLHCNIQKRTTGVNGGAFLAATCVGDLVYKLYLDIFWMTVHPFAK